MDLIPDLHWRTSSTYPTVHILIFLMVRLRPSRRPPSTRPPTTRRPPSPANLWQITMNYQPSWSWTSVHLFGRLPLSIDNKLVQSIIQILPWAGRSIVKNSSTRSSQNDNAKILARFWSTWTLNLLRDICYILYVDWKHTLETMWIGNTNRKECGFSTEKF